MTNVMSWSATLAVGSGAALGACARWWLGVLLNPLLPALPLGTLAANLIGGYLVGVAIGIFHLYSSLDPLLKLFIITGVLGGLTTFSAFSAETVERLMSGRAGYALALCALHLVGSLVMTWLGLLSVGARRVFMT
ncbi:MAG: fluoride efflux transporter CrcB [Betaproteobacteria bacterium]|nr:fluoride efflux transporter CrcB [Betaproteobacteria bacterium]